MTVDDLIDFYQGLTPESTVRFSEFYSEDAYFKDPFNEVRGVAGIRRIFDHMFRQLAAPRFVVTGKVADGGGAVLLWEFHFRFRLPGCSGEHVMRGVSHLKFDPDGRVCFHRDYWDTAEELYMKLPVLGTMMRGLRQLLAAG